jgi:hypothetical protein
LILPLHLNRNTCFEQGNELLETPFYPNCAGFRNKSAIFHGIIDLLMHLSPRADLKTECKPSQLLFPFSRKLLIEHLQFVRSGKRSKDGE